MELRTIKVADCHESPTNPRGTKFNNAEFSELVASVKEKGVLMPVLARPVGNKFEIVAGNRRLRAAKEAGLKEIPAHIADLSDIEAREAQIVENLQRADVHPLEEGAAYRDLIEQSGYDIAAVATRVGKSESYVRNRLVLTNLIKPAQTAFRSDIITASHAALIARLDEKLQKDALDYLNINVSSEWRDVPSASDLRDWIREQTLAHSMTNPPWANDEEMKAALGGCDECKGKGGDLFGKRSADACTNPTCYANRMAAYVAIKLAADPTLVRVSGEWGSNDEQLPSKGQYKILTSKKDKCEYESRVIVVSGDNIGRVLRVCMDGECKKHWKQYERKAAGNYEPTAKEKAARKRAAAVAKKRKADDASSFQTALAKLSLPLSQKHLDALFDFALYRCGGSYQQPTVTLLGIEVVRKQEKSYSDPKKMRTVRDYEATLRKYAADNGNEGKLRVVFGLLMPHPAPGYPDYGKAIKKL